MSIFLSVLPCQAGHCKKSYWCWLTDWLTDWLTGWWSGRGWAARLHLITFLSSHFRSVSCPLRFWWSLPPTRVQLSPVTSKYFQPRQFSPVVIESRPWYVNGENSASHNGVAATLTRCEMLHFALTAWQLFIFRIPWPAPPAGGNTILSSPELLSQ